MLAFTSKLQQPTKKDHDELEETSSYTSLEFRGDSLNYIIHITGLCAADIIEHFISSVSSNGIHSLCPQRQFHYCNGKGGITNLFH